MYAQYTQLHDHTWDEVMQKMFEANMRNFVVYYHEPTGPSEYCRHHHSHTTLTPSRINHTPSHHRPLLPSLS